MLVVGLLSSGIGVIYVAGPMAEKEASPTIKERLTKDTSTDTLMGKEDEFYYIKDNDCDEVQRIHIDKSTKSDKVITGRHGQSLRDGTGHTTTLQRAD